MLLEKGKRPRASGQSLRASKSARKWLFLLLVQRKRCQGRHATWLSLWIYNVAWVYCLSYLMCTSRAGPN